MTQHPNFFSSFSRPQSFLPPASKLPFEAPTPPWPASLTRTAARVAASNTASTFLFCRAEVSKYPFAPMESAILWPYKDGMNSCQQIFWDLTVGSQRGIGDKDERRTVARSVNRSGEKVPFAIALSRRSVLHATRMTGIALPQIDLTSSIH